MHYNSSDCIDVAKITWRRPGDTPSAGHEPMTTKVIRVALSAWRVFPIIKGGSAWRVCLALSVAICNL